MRIFLAVAREGTLGGAARKLGQTHPTMGRRIRALEEAVGHRLFHRTSDGYTLTDEGASVLMHAERVEEEAMAFERQLAGRGEELQGIVRVSASEWFGLHMLAPVFSQFVQAHPGVTIELITENRNSNLSRREADMAFRIRPFEEPEVVQRLLLHVDYALYAAPGVPIPRAGDGKDSTLVTMNTAYARMPDVVWLKRMLPNARIALRSNNRDVQARMCAAGAGLAILPRPMADGMPGLKRISLGEAPPGRDVWVGYHRDLASLARLRALLRATIRELSLGPRRKPKSLQSSR